MHKRLTQYSLRPRRWTLVVICLCTAVVFGQVKQDPKDMASANDLVLTELPRTESARNAWRDRISASRETSKDALSRKKLQDTLRRLKSMRFADLEDSDQPATPQDSNQLHTKPQPKPVTRPIIIIRPPDPNVPGSPSNTAKVNTSLTKGTTDALIQLAQSPGRLLKPEALGQILFQANAFPEAAICYEEALKRLNTQTVAPTENKAWLLFQIGNCLRPSDLDKAMRIYKQLISEYPHSLWAELVKVKGQWITWEIRDKPKALISEIKRQMNDRNKPIARN